jgi:Ca2+-binding RTX toxin-like protein
MSGNQGTDTIGVQGSLAEGDDFVFQQQGTQAILDRVNLGPFKLTVDTSEAFAVAGEGGNDRFAVKNLANTDVNAVNFTGGNGNDWLDGSGTSTPITATGDAGSDRLTGSRGDDTLSGGAGFDTLTGGRGDDTLAGGSGRDFFNFLSPNDGIDTIQDFNVDEDLIRVSAAGFGGGLTAGATITADQFALGAAAADAGDRFIYNDANGKLFFDVDGTGGAAQSQLATLTGAPDLSFNDIFVV